MKARILGSHSDVLFHFPSLVTRRNADAKEVCKLIPHLFSRSLVPFVELLAARIADVVVRGNFGDDRSPARENAALDCQQEGGLRYRLHQLL